MVHHEISVKLVFHEISERKISCYIYVMFMLYSNEPIKVAYLQKVSQSINVE